MIKHHYLLLTIFLFLFLFLPGKEFAQREYFSALLMIPMTAIFFSSPSNIASIPRSYVVSSILLCAAAISLKAPYFVFPSLTLCLFLIFFDRNIVFIIKSGIITSLFLAAFATIASLILFPDYINLLEDVLLNVYITAKLPITGVILVRESTLMIVGFTLCALLMRIGGNSREVQVLLAVSVGYYLAYLLQGKGFPYHAFPTFVFLVAAIGVSIGNIISRASLAGTKWRRSMNLGGFGALAIAAAGVYLYPFVMDASGGAKGLEMPNWRHPTMMAIAPTHDVGFPLKHRLGGVWIADSPAQSIATYSRYLLKRSSLSEYEQRTLNQLYSGNLHHTLEAVKLKQPQIILVSNKPQDQWLVEALKEIDVKFLDDYHRVGSYGDADIYEIEPLKNK